MASSTTDYTLANSNWTQVSTGTGRVIISNRGTLTVHYAVATSASDLTNIIGHEITSRKTEELEGLGANNVYVKSANTGGGAVITVTAY